MLAALCLAFANFNELINADAQHRYKGNEGKENGQRELMVHRKAFQSSFGCILTRDIEWGLRSTKIIAEV